MIHPVKIDKSPFQIGTHLITNKHIFTVYQLPIRGGTVNKPYDFWRIFIIFAEDKDYIKNIEVVDNLKEMMEGFDGIPKAVRALKEIKGMQ